MGTDAAALAGPPEPTWRGRPYDFAGGSGHTLREFTDCPAGMYDSEPGPGLDAGGDLLPPGPDLAAVINAVEVDPAVGWLFAGYSSGPDHGAGCAHLFRTAPRDEVGAEWADEAWPRRPMSSVPADMTAVDDVTGLTAYGDDGTGFHQPAVGDCHHDVSDLPASGVLVGFFSPDSGLTYQRWYSRGAGAHRFVHFTNGDNVLGVHHEETCWPASYSSSQYNLEDPADPSTMGITCFDKDDTDMDFECGGDGADALDDQHVRTIRRILPYAWDHALAIREAACADSTCTTSVAGRLQLAEHDGTTDVITWTPVDTTSLDAALTPRSSCTTASYHGAYLDAVHDAAPYWDHRRVTGVDWGFPSIGDLAWGSPDPWPAVYALSTRTPGGGVQEVDPSW